jgi:hypothetical protein
MKPKPTSRIPMLLSAFVCPGAGQFMQRRWVAGSIFATGFLVGFFWLMVLALGIIINFYRMGFDIGYEPGTPNVVGMLPPFLIAMSFYIASLFDVLAANLQLTRTKPEEKINSASHTPEPKP